MVSRRRPIRINLLDIIIVFGCAFIFRQPMIHVMRQSSATIGNNILSIKNYQVQWRCGDPWLFRVGVSQNLDDTVWIRTYVFCYLIGYLGWNAELVFPRQMHQRSPVILLSLTVVILCSQYRKMWLYQMFGSWPRIMNELKDDVWSTVLSLPNKRKPHRNGN